MNFCLLSVACVVLVPLSTRASKISPDSRYRLGETLFADDFEHGLGHWQSELEKGGSVRCENGALVLNVPAGCSVWLKPQLKGPVLIQYEATAVAKGGPNDRVSDLNCFWMARDTRSPQDIFATKRSGKFADYNQLLTYYVGIGGNANTTTRFRRYIGDAVKRPLRPQDDLSAPEDLLKPNATQTVQLVADGPLIQCFRDGKKLFEMNDAAPYTSGWFAFRTVQSHLLIRHFRVWRLEPAH
jgi:hypothetical protein